MKLLSINLAGYVAAPMALKDKLAPSYPNIE